MDELYYLVFGKRQKATSGDRTTKTIIGAPYRAFAVRSHTKNSPQDVQKFDYFSVRVNDGSLSVEPVPYSRIAKWVEPAYHRCLIYAPKASARVSAEDVFRLLKG